MDLTSTIAHLHLIINHVPTIGTVTGIGLLLLALVRRNEHVTHASLEVLFLVALVTLPTFITGVASQAAVEDLEGPTQAIIAAHQDAALAAFVLMEITGALAWLTLWQIRRRTAPAPWAVPLVLLFSAFTLAVMANTATLGGEIRHAEIRTAEAVSGAVPGFGWLTKASVQYFVSENALVWPMSEAIHFFGLSLALGIVLTVNLRLLGFMKGIPFATLHGLLPWGLLGFGINLVTGMLFVVHAPDYYTENVPFFWKIALLMIAGANFLYVTVVNTSWSLESEQDAPVFDKAMAGLSIAVWLGVIYAGRMLPFIGNAF